MVRPLTGRNSSLFVLQSSLQRLLLVCTIEQKPKNDRRDARAVAGPGTKTEAEAAKSQ